MLSRSHSEIIIVANLQAQAGLKLGVSKQVMKDGTDKESIISDSYGESFPAESPDAHDYYGR